MSEPKAPYVTTCTHLDVDLKPQADREALKELRRHLIGALKAVDKLVDGSIDNQRSNDVN